MKTIVVILLIAAALAGAETLWENPYDRDLYANSLWSYGDRRCQDDFTLEGDAVIEAFTCWGMFNYWSGDFEVTIFSDFGGRLGIPWWSGVLPADVSWVEDGYYSFKRFDFEPAEPVMLPAGTGTWWIEFYSLDYEFAWAAGAGGNMLSNGVDTGYDAFFGVYGEWEPEPAVEEMSWGAIKATF